jgi:N-acetylglucosaminyldiphosphoundecaprenol N-acetyl-beta-D-mannosaminyltransferase
MEAYPSLNIAGVQHGYISEEEYRLLVDRINSSKADILFVGLGSPRQEKWIHHHQKNLKVKVCMGVGGSLDVIAGRASRAPLAFQTLGLEWLYRLIKEPARFKRQLALPKFAWEVLKERIAKILARNLKELQKEKK